MSDRALLAHALEAIAATPREHDPHGRRDASRLRDVEVLAVVEGERLVFRCRLDGTPMLVRCIERDAAHRQFRYLEALSSARSGVLRVPAPVTIADIGTPGPRPSGRPAWAALVLEHLNGTPCTALVDPVGTHGSASRSGSAVAPGDGGAAVAAMALAGRALAELHAIDPGTGRRRERSGHQPSVEAPAGLDVLEVANAADHLTDLVRPDPARLMEAYPSWRSVIERAVGHVASAPRVDPTGANGATPAVLHRDVHLRQMFLHGGRIGLVDWDLAALGDPAFDVAYLATHLATHLERSDELIDALLDGYADPTMTPDRLAPFRSFNLLRRACRRFRVRDAGWEQEMIRMLTMLRDTLDDIGVAA